MKNKMSFNNRRSLSEELLPLAFILSILIILSLVVALFSRSKLSDLLVLSIGVFFYFFPLGYSILLNLNLSYMERIGFGVPLSGIILSLWIYHLNVLFKLPISTLSVGLSIVFFSSLGWFWPQITRLYNSFLGKRKKHVANK